MTTPNNKLPLSREQLNMLQPAVDRATSEFAKPLLKQALAAIELQDDVFTWAALSDHYHEKLFELKEIAEEMERALIDMSIGEAPYDGMMSRALDKFRKWKENQ